MRVLYWLFFWFNFPILLGWALIGLVLAGLGYLVRHQELERYGMFIAIGADQMGNVYAAGFPDETISSRVGRAVVSGHPRIIARFLHRLLKAIFFWQNDHAVESIEHSEEFDKRYEPWPWHKKD